MHRAYKNGERKLEIFSAAGLINRFYEGCPLNEIYDKGVRYYDILLYLIENAEGADKLSGLIKLPPVKVKSAAMKIINLLLFNRENNPFLSLGLSDDATVRDAKKRWKRLLMLYHPDRSPSLKISEELTKKINQAYREIENLGENNFQHQINPNNHRDKSGVKINTFPSGKNLHLRAIRSYNFKYLKYLPAAILIIAISLAILITAIFIIQK